MQRWKFLTRWMVAIGLALSIGVSKSVFAQSNGHQAAGAELDR
jgi:hypothetical protein